MNFGQMSIKGLSEKTDFLQLDVCGLSELEAIERYLSYRQSIPIILHGDWTKKGNSENNIEFRWIEYINIIKSLKAHTKVLGFTIHPPFKRKVTFEDFLFYCNKIETLTEIPVFIENRSSNKIWLSEPYEIIEFSKQHNMTIDLPQLYISSKYDINLFLHTISLINWENIKEIHMANIKRDGSHTYVARKIDDGELDFNKVIKFIKEVSYCTLEILGGVNTFDKEVDKIKYLKETE